jgi:hypothetical protein
MDLPFPYYFGHAMIALFIMATTGYVAESALFGFICGAGAYTVREIKDYYSAKGRERVSFGQTRFDWPGFLAPVLSTLTLYLFYLGGHYYGWF